MDLWAKHRRNFARAVREYWMLFVWAMALIALFPALYVATSPQDAGAQGGILGASIAVSGSSSMTEGNMAMYALYQTMISEE